MTKYVIRTVELVKRVYLVEAYSKSEAYDKLIEMGPDEAVEVEVLGDHIFHEETINEYEYNKDWKPETKQQDWVGAEITTSGKVRHRSEWVYAPYDGRPMPDDGRLEKPDRLKGPALNEIW